jgi:hypothetical protein
MKKKETESAYPLPVVWFAVMPEAESTSLKLGASSFAEACEILFKLQAKGYKDAHILMTARI